VPVLLALTLPVQLTARILTDETGRRVMVPDHPQRLVSLAPNITETVFALGLGDKTVGDTNYCDYPVAAKSKPHVGASLNPSLEAIVALKPDLVLGTPGANRRETADQLEKLGIPLYGVTAHSLEGTMEMIADLGRVLDCEDAAHRLVDSLRKRINAVDLRVKGKPQPKVLFVVWYRPLQTAGPRSFINDVIRRAGGQSISEGLQGEWPRVSLEEVLRLDPDVILFPSTESFSPPLEEFQQMPGWRDLRAVKERRLYSVSEAIIHPSPRLVDALEQVTEVLHPHAAPAADSTPLVGTR
jgi:iron complex transport system substrate-binding protein